MLLLSAMPILHSAEKRMRADRKRRDRNLWLKSELKTLTRKLRAQIQAGEAGPARETFRTFVKRLDKAAGKQVLHRNTASRRKSRLALAIAKIKGPGPA